MGCAPSSEEAGKYRVVVSNRNQNSAGEASRTRLATPACGDTSKQTDIFEAKRLPSNHSAYNGKKPPREACGDASVTQSPDEARPAQMTLKSKNKTAEKREHGGDNANSNAFKSHAGQGDTSTLLKKGLTESLQTLHASKAAPLGKDQAGTKSSPSPVQEELLGKSSREEKASDDAALTYSPRALSLNSEQSETWSEATLFGSDTEQDNAAEQGRGDSATGRDERTKSDSDTEIEDALREIQLNLDKAEQTKIFKDRRGSCDENLKEGRKSPSKSYHSSIDYDTKPAESTSNTIQRSRSSPCGKTSTDNPIQSQYPKHLAPEYLQVSTITSVTSSSVSMFVPSDKQVRPNTPLPARLQKRLGANKSSWKHGYNCEEKQMIAAAFREEEKEKRLRKAREYEQRRRQVQSRRSTNMQHALEEEILQSHDSTSKEDETE